MSPMDKLKGFETIFTLAGESMEWEKIEEDILKEEMEKPNVEILGCGSSPEEYSQGFLELQENAESHDVIQIYKTQFA